MERGTNLLSGKIYNVQRYLDLLKKLSWYQNELYDSERFPKVYEFSKVNSSSRSQIMNQTRYFWELNIHKRYLHNQLS